MPHKYQSWPWSWLLLGRPVAYAYSEAGPCGAGHQCAAETLALGTPALWWAFIPALLVSCWQWIACRDWRPAAAIVGAAAGIVPWFAFPDRTMFYFYALPALPFLVLAVTFSLGLVLGSESANRDRRLVGAVIVGGYVMLVAAAFGFFWPIYTSEILTFGQWRARIWLNSWI
ncbi:hypothetical protein [Fodinicola feengrottensis]|uniref:hypothetical protein n=1 Tax=Fodinicola feengrottensis TaxID=435914 RepID=UPI00244196A8